MEYHFNTDVAKEIGVDEAIICYNLDFWLEKNIANHKHFYDGKFWTYNSARAWSELFSFWTQKQITRIFSSLKKQGIIEVGNYNKVKYDRTNWYTLTKRYYSITLNGQMEPPNEDNGVTQKDEPIPYKKPDTNQDIKLIYKPEEKEVFVLWINSNLMKHKVFDIDMVKALRSTLKKRSLDDIKKAIINYSYVFHSEKHFYSHKATFESFMKRKIKTFYDEAEPLINYVSGNYNTKEPFKPMNPTKIDYSENKL